MIPKPLNEIEWSDIEALRDSGREEDDTIEFKASFSGGSDYLEFNDAKRAKAIEGVAREAIAFMNGRGGDIVIGVREAANDHPKIEEFTPVQNIDQTVQRLEQSLAALIEPTQSVLGIRAIRQNGGDSDGAIVVRCPSSLRAPHRFKPTKECYIRRGRESVPMPMDEVQDLTLVRTAKRSEILTRLDSALGDIGFIKARRTALPNERLRLKMAYQPLVSGEIAISSATLTALRHTKPELTMSNRPFDYLSVFDCLDHDGKPKLRGRIYEGSRERGARQVYCSTSISSSLALEWDYVDSGRFHSDKAAAEVGLYDAWVIGFFARAILSLRKILELNSAFAQGVLRVGYFCNGIQRVIVGDGHFGETFDLPEELIMLPDFEVTDIASLKDIFGQLQEDFYAIAGVENPNKFLIANWE